MLVLQCLLQRVLLLTGHIGTPCSFPICPIGTPCLQVSHLRILLIDVTSSSVFLTHLCYVITSPALFAPGFVLTCPLLFGDIFRAHL